MAKQNLAVPISIVVAGGFIAVALFFGGQGATGGPTAGNDAAGHGDTFGNNNSGAAENIRAIDENDHVFGNPDAAVTIVEFSDFECPFCSRLHPTLERVVQESDGNVNWVYRHFPLTSIHPQAQPAAYAAECVARLADNDAFWEFSSTLFNNQRSLGTNLYTQTAAQYGISESDLTSCMNQSDVRSRVAQDLREATTAGGRGTPFSIIVSANGQFLPFSGALPYDQVKPLIEQALVN